MSTIISLPIISTLSFALKKGLDQWLIFLLICVCKQKYLINFTNIMNCPTPRFGSSTEFLELPYDELLSRNLKVKQSRAEWKSESYYKDMVFESLKKQKGIKAVILAFCNMEGMLHMLDYNKYYFLNSCENLTFDGSSIKGFSEQASSDLKLSPDWSTFRWLPADIFGNGKVLLFANIHDSNGDPYKSDFRHNLSVLMHEHKKDDGYVINAAPEIEGFLVENENAEQDFDERVGFTLASRGGYFNTLPQDVLRQFIDRSAEAMRALAFENEKDHPEVAPSQFELNHKYTDVVQACDQILLYKMICRQIAKNMGHTATFLPKPIVKINGSGMHVNMSISKEGKNLFYDKMGKYNLSELAHDFSTGILYYANELCLGINSSVNAYRRLDPKFEAPNEIKISSADRSAMVRVPIGNEKSSRIEVRSLPPDTNPYLAHYLFLKAGFKVINSSEAEKKEFTQLHLSPIKKLHGNIHDAIRAFKKSDFMKEVFGEVNFKKFLSLKTAVADRCAKELGTRVKTGEVWYHHEVTNQVLWNKF